VAAFGGLKKFKMAAIAMVAKVQKMLIHSKLHKVLQ
jgi:hypothetical protein